MEVHNSQSVKQLLLLLQKLVTQDSELSGSSFIAVIILFSMK